MLFRVLKGEEFEWEGNGRHTGSQNLWRRDVSCMQVINLDILIIFTF